MPNMSPNKVKMPEQDPNVRNKNFEEVSLGYTKEQAMEEATRCLNCKKPFCMDGCPVGVPIPEFIHHVAEGEFEEAYQTITRENALPAICGRVCPQENQCEGKCVRGIKTESVGIGRLERFVADYHREQSYVYDCTYDVTDTVTIKCHNALIPVVQRKHMDIETVWTIYANGIIDMQSSVKVGENLPVIPRFGLRFFTKGENVKYYGYGPYESYSDKHLCTYLDEFNTTVSDMYEPYIKPQENGSHFGTRYVETENIRVSSDTPFSFSALHYTQEELTEKKHNFELEKCDDTVLCIDYKQNGIGQNSCGPLTQEEYRFDESEFEFKIRIEIK